MLKSLAKIALPLMLISGCQTAPGKPACPTLIIYSKAELDQFRRELAEAQGRYPAVTRQIIDYSKVRDQIRNCRGIK